jgi:4-nitrophenyl phosphatase
MTEVVAGHEGGAKTASFVVDLDGVLYLEDQGVPGAGDSLALIHDLGHALVFVTNNSSRTADDVATRIGERTGFTPRPDSILTSAMAAGHHLHGRAGRAFVVGSSGLAATLEGYGVAVVADWRAADAVVVGIDFDLSYERLSSASRAVRAGATFVATNLDTTLPTPTGLALGGGAIAAAIATASDVEPFVCGKPHRPIRELIHAKIESGPVWVVGDRPETDLAMAKAEGWRSVLVLSGVTTDLDEVPEALRPDVVLASIAELPQVVLG